MEGQAYMPSRRAAVLGALAATALLPKAPWAEEPATSTGDSTNRTVLRLERRTIDVNGKPASVFGIRQTNGLYGIRSEKGRAFRVRLENRINEPSLIHWHGLTPPWQQDGVPGISGPAIAPGASADYDFPLPFGGTFWMHSHQGLQEQLLMSAPLIIDDERNRRDQQEIVLMLADFSFTPPAQIFAQLRNRSMPGMATPVAASDPGMVMAPAPQPEGAQTSLPSSGAADLNDVRYDAFLANDRTLADPEVIKVEPGGKVLLRVINGSSMTSYHVDLGQLTGELIAVDGFEIAPMQGRRFPIAAAQRLDIRLALPREPAAHPVLAIVEGRLNQTGIILSAGRTAIGTVPAQIARASPALTLDLESRLRAAAPLPPRKADRVHTINLTGQMNGYIWSINGVPWNKNVPPLPVAKGQRVELVMTNQTRMPHPMHLHGHTFQVVEIDGKRFPGARRDTVLVTPGRRVVVAFDANNPGTWAFHCHLLYHLDAGMFTTLRYV
jgi:FtsP/CotA-like multicopper oxidase with cupredoxin domain